MSWENKYTQQNSENSGAHHARSHGRTTLAVHETRRRRHPTLFTLLGHRKQNVSKLLLTMIESCFYNLTTRWRIGGRDRAGRRQHGTSWPAFGLVLLAMAPCLIASENVPRKPFAEWATLPAPHAFIVRLWYQEAEAYHIWDNNRQHNVTVDRGSDEYGIDRMQGIIALEYGIAERWTADLNVGYGTVGTRSFNPDGSSESTTGLLDTGLGVRYQLFRERTDGGSWVPTLTFRAGAVLPGSFDKEFPFAPGNKSAAIEPGLLMRKHFGWQGFGAYCDAFYRWMKTTGDDQYAVAVGFLQETKGWTLNAGYRHFQQISGSNLDYRGLGEPLEYSPEVREISDAIEAGFSYTTPTRHIRYGFYTRKTVDGSNTDSALWISGYVEVPFGGTKK